MSSLMTTSQASDTNLITSIWQHLLVNVKTPYDIAAIAAGLNQGLTTNQDNSLTVDALGLGILDAEIDRDTLYKRVPVIAYELDYGGSHKSPKSTGCGDGANWEWRCIKLTCVPTVQVNADGTVTASRAALLLLKDLAWAAIGRTYILKIVDTSQPKVNGLYPYIGYAEIQNAQPPYRESYKDFLIVDRRDFDIKFDIRIASLTNDGL